MSFVFDNGPLSHLFRHYYRSVFVTLWDNFDALVDGGAITSAREVLREIEDSSIEPLRIWAADNVGVFQAPTAKEAACVAQIDQVPHFQQNIEMQKILKGGLVADPFVIAKAKIEGKTVVTTEKFKPNAAKIPNICRHFGVPCMSLEEFMEGQGWKF